MENFDENKTEEETVSTQPEPEISDDQDTEHTVSDDMSAGNTGDNADGVRPDNNSPVNNVMFYGPDIGQTAGGGYVPAGNYTGQAYAPQPKKRRLTDAGMWILLAITVVCISAIMILAAAIAIRGKENEVAKEFFADHMVTNTAEHKEIVIPTSPKPVLEDELYADKETGLLTSVGVAEKILPSQVKIEIYGDVPYYPVSSGSGVIISSDGYIVTNAHVVDGSKNIAVKLYDKTSEKASFVGMDRKSDLAVIKIDRDDLTSAELGMSSDLSIGEEVALAGAGGGFENTVTYGHITGLDRVIDTNYITSSSIHCIQTDAALNPGNSGGALVNMYGQVVGIAVALMDHQSYENIGFNIAIDDAVPIVEDIIANGYVTSRSRVGISFVSIGDTAAAEYGIMPGLCVLDIDETCDVAYTDIIQYDIIMYIDDVRTLDSPDVVKALEGKVPGDRIKLTVFRKSITGETSVFDEYAELAPDTSSISGYSGSISEEDYFSRDIIR